MILNSLVDEWLYKGLHFQILQVQHLPLTQEYFFVHFFYKRPHFLFDVIVYKIPLKYPCHAKL